MRKAVYFTAATLFVTPLVSSPAFAQQQPQQQQQSARKTPDPNEVVCEKQQETGSRLASERVCMTRSEWAEQRRLSRQEVDKAQVQRSMSAPQ
jgi:invasion protein IalB